MKEHILKADFLASALGTVATGFWTSGFPWEIAVTLTTSAGTVLYLAARMIWVVATERTQVMDQIKSLRTTQELFFKRSTDWRHEVNSQIAQLHGDDRKAAERLARLEGAMGPNNKGPE